MILFKICLPKKLIALMLIYLFILGNSSDTSFLTVKEPHEINKSHYSTWENSELKLPSTQELSQIREIREVLKLPKIENKHRIKIAKAVITHLQDRDPDRKLMRAEFMQLAQSIAEIFTSELKETYYVPFKNGHLPKGKLYDAYNNNRTRLRDAGLIRRRTKMESEDKKSSANSTICENFEIIDVCNMEILKTGRNASWDEVVTVWQNSHGFRQNELRNLNVKPFDYVDKYVVLLNEKCHELFEMDFKILYPNAESIDRWKLYYQKVIEKSRNMRDSWIKDIIKGAEEAEDEDTKLAISLMLAPYILPNPRKLKKIDVQESFISHSPNDPFVEEGDDEYPQTVKRLKIESEPKIHFIGRSDKMVSHAYVDMPGLRLRFDNPLKAFEVCFHCFMAMNIPYPKTCFCNDVPVPSPSFSSVNRADSPYNKWISRSLPSAQEFCQVREIREMLKIPKLENKHRTKVAKIIIAYLLDSENDRRLMREDFYQLAQTITEIFPSELRETYYVPFKSGHLPKGKLYDAYKNHRTKFRVAGMIPTRSKATDWEDNQCTIVANAAILNDDHVEECDESEVVILTSGCASWDEVLTMWRKTHNFRQNELQNENMKPMEYIDKYVVLLNEKCYELFEMDFKMLYPNSKNVDQWKLYYTKVVDMTRNMRDNCIKSTIQYVEESEDEVTKLAFALMLVPYILRNPRQRRKVEIQESFISYSLNDPFAEDDEKDCNQTVKRLKIESEPKIYFIGSASKKINHAYVDMLGLRLKFENPLKAFEACFHCFMTMSIPYPRSCMYVWILIQQLIFDVITKKDAVLPIITTLINDLNKLENYNI